MNENYTFPPNMVSFFVFKEKWFCKLGNKFQEYVRVEAKKYRQVGLNVTIFMVCIYVVMRHICV